MATTCLKTVVGVSKGMLPVKYFCLIRASFLCQLNFMEIIVLSQSYGESGHRQFSGYYRI